MPKKDKIKDKADKMSTLQSNQRIMTSPNSEEFRPQTIISPKSNAIIAFSIFLFTLVIYQITNAKSVSFWDSGEYIASSSILGIPHPPGNPFFILAGRFFTIFNFGLDHAIMISFMVSLFGALGVMFTYLITVQLISMWSNEKFMIFAGSFIAAILTAFSYTYWMNSIDPGGGYSGMAFIINVSIWLILVWVKKQQDFSHQNILLLIIYLLFIGFSIHQTTLQIAPAILFIAVYPYIKDSFRSFSFWGKFVLYLIGLLIVYIIFDGIGIATNIPELAKLAFGVALVCIMIWYLRGFIGKRAWLLGLLMVLIGFSTHLFLLARSGYRPFINEGHPHNFTMFMDYILRRQYGGYNFLHRRGDFYIQGIYHFVRYFTWQFMDAEIVSNWFKMPFDFVMGISNMLMIFLGVYGFYYSYKRNKNSFAYLMAIFFMVSVAMVFVMNLSDAEVRDRDYFFATAYNFWAVAMGIGAVGVLKHFTNKKFLKYILACLLLIYPLFNMVSQYYKHNRKGEYIALGYGLNLLNGLEENAIIFTNGDNDTFPVWYAQAVADRNAYEHSYPAENVFPTARTNELIQRGLDWKSTHIKGIRQDVVVANLSLLNTPWFLKQLRDLDSIELNWTDEQIDSLRPAFFPTDMEVNIVSPNGERFSIVYPAGTAMAIQDISVARIIQDNFGKRPIYFAVTVPGYSGFENHLINEGMVSRVVSTTGNDRLNYERIKNNLNNVYFYGGIFNERLFKDENKTKLIANYGAAHMRLAEYYQDIGDDENSLKYFERALEFVLNEEEKSRFYGSLIVSNASAGNIERAEELLSIMIAENPDSIQPYFTGAIAMVRANDFDRVFYYLQEGLNIDPFHRQLIALTFQIGFEYDKREEAHGVIMSILPFQPHLADFLDTLLDPTKTIDDL